MAPFFGLIKDLQPGKSKVTLTLRVIRSYKVPQMQNKNEDYSREVVMHDSEVNCTLSYFNIDIYYRLFH